MKQNYRHVAHLIDVCRLVEKHAKFRMCFWEDNWDIYNVYYNAYTGLLIPLTVKTRNKTLTDVRLGQLGPKWDKIRIF